MTNQQPGTIGWIDLTVTDADAVRDFYQAVAGWTPDPVSMGDYNDYNMLPQPGSDPVAGICHARGPNAGLPAQWLMYIVVADLDASLEAVVRGGGEVLVRRPPASWGAMAVIRDPAGAVCALFQNNAADSDSSSGTA